MECLVRQAMQLNRIAQMSARLPYVLLFDRIIGCNIVWATDDYFRRCFFEANA